MEIPAIFQLFLWAVAAHSTGDLAQWSDHWSGLGDAALIGATGETASEVICVRAPVAKLAKKTPGKQQAGAVLILPV